MVKNIFPEVDIQKLKWNDEDLLYYLFVIIKYINIPGFTIMYNLLFNL